MFRSWYTRFVFQGKEAALEASLSEGAYRGPQPKVGDRHTKQSPLGVDRSIDPIFFYTKLEILNEIKFPKDEAAKRLVYQAVFLMYLFCEVYLLYWCTFLWIP